MGLRQLRVLALTCLTGRVEAGELAPLEQLRQLRSLTIHCSRTHEEAVAPVFAAFPDTLLKLKGLSELAFSSMGG